jgi:hypothetical protein
VKTPQREPTQQPHIERIQREVQEIAGVLSHQSGRSIVEVWTEALTLHRVRYETVPLIDDREDEPLKPAISSLAAS